MKNFYLFILCISICSVHLVAQDIIYTPAQEFDVIGKADMNSPYFHRVDTLLYNDLPKDVKDLCTNSAGLAISFRTNSSVIKVKWQVSHKINYSNMSPIVRSGLDLYIKEHGRWIFAGAGKPQSKISKRTIVEHMNHEMKECLLYLPLYDEITNLEIGIDKSSSIFKNGNPFKGKIVVYGSSITQGASSSRPGLGFTSLLSRSSGWQFINLGFSGSGKMEYSAAKMIADIHNVDAFILDCIPNPSPKEIRERTNKFVKTIRERYPQTPIIFIKSMRRESGNFNIKINEYVKEQNKAIEDEIKRLKREGVVNIYLMKEDNFLGKDHEGSIDGEHPNDIGFFRMIEICKDYFSKILKIKFS